MGPALLTWWFFSGSTGAGGDVAHASAAEGYGFRQKARSGATQAENS